MTNLEKIQQEEKPYKPFQGGLMLPEKFTSLWLALFREFFRLRLSG